jgi:hypothetical protein
VKRVRAAISFADSRRKTAWIARCAAAAVIAGDHSIGSPLRKGCRGVRRLREALARGRTPSEFHPDRRRRFA